MSVKDGSRRQQVWLVTLAWKGHLCYGKSTHGWKRNDFSMHAQKKHGFFFFRKHGHFASFSFYCLNSPMSMYFVSWGVPMALHRIRTYWKRSSPLLVYYLEQVWINNHTKAKKNIDTLPLHDSQTLAQHPPFTTSEKRQIIRKIWNSILYIVSKALR